MQAESVHQTQPSQVQGPVPSVATKMVCPGTSAQLAGPQPLSGTSA